jgi:hypothetical protein
MSELKVTKTRMQSGTWKGIVTGASETPRLVVTHLEDDVAGVTLTATNRDGEWLLEIPIPADAIADGVQTLLIVDRSTGTKLESITLIAGEALGDDLRAEVDLLRAELDMLKRAFRRHCVETG